ncbi:protein of unknown function (DUF3134) [Rubidibacter lacunae KORDI 51-2]|uniref:DUF3134 domain-containing protein n=1 Tax=Rubidibacter lacunae KORDI 51-2 TaxID=582515 RepID=U5D9Y1_9CHRO|nr:DUF3134 domain-containing protein [Rubidibacter lacunae]ERN41393.1 protein of unknown function (DUF3134) [Rubidibacter lacunae KORDI 51-2]
MQNPSLRQESRYEPAAVIPVQRDESLLDWLRSNNRLIARESVEESGFETEDEEISDLMDGDDREYTNASEEQDMDN